MSDAGPAIRVTSDIGRLRARLSDVARKQIPFATALALTRTAQAAQVAVTRSMPSVFDKPNPFTMRAVAIQPATKAKPEARVFVRPVQAEYLRLEETGGVRTPKRKALVMPAAARVNQHGNLPRGAMRTLKARKDVFVGQVNGTGGVWQRPARKGKGRQGAKLAPKLLISFQPRAKYQPRFGFNNRVERVVRATIGPALREALTKAMRGRV